MTVVGSMEVIGVFNDLNLFLSIKRVQADMKKAGAYVKETSVEMLRAAKNSSLLGKALGLIGIGGFISLLTTMPRVNAQLSLAKTWVSLIGLEMDDNLAPAIEKINTGLESLYGWFKELPESQQSFLIWSGIVVGGLTSLGIAGAIASKALKGLGLSEFIAELGAFASSLGTIIASSLAAQVAIGLLVGALSVLVLDKIGVLDWISSLGENFRKRAEEGDTLAQAVKAILSPLALLGDGILVLLGIKGWDEFKTDLSETIDLFETLLQKVADFYAGTGKYIWNAVMPTDYEIHDTGGMAGYTGLHHVKAGEKINNEPSSNLGSGGAVVVNNYFGDVSLNNGMDWNEFLTQMSQGQADLLSWRSTR